jgi:hypothetical protein
MAEFPLIQNGKILCLACQDEGITFYAKRITAKHLIGKHKKFFPNIKTAVQEYRTKYPNGDIAVNDRSRELAGITKSPTQLTNVTQIIKKEKAEELEWKRQNKKLFDELEDVKTQLDGTENPVLIKKLKLRKDMILGQQKVIKEITPARGAFNPQNETSSKLDPLQIKALNDIVPLLQKISENLGQLHKVDPSVERCLS